MRVVVLAGENIKVGVVRLVGEMRGNARSLDELEHGIARDALFFAEIHHMALAEALHVDALTQRHDELLDFLRIADGCSVAPVEVYRSEESPCVCRPVLLA